MLTCTCIPLLSSISFYCLVSLSLSFSIPSLFLNLSTPFTFRLYPPPTNINPVLTLLLLTLQTPLSIKLLLSHRIPCISTLFAFPLLPNLPFPLPPFCTQLPVFHSTTFFPPSFPRSSSTITYIYKYKHKFLCVCVCVRVINLCICYFHLSIYICLSDYIFVFISINLCQSIHPYIFTSTYLSIYVSGYIIAWV